MTKRPTTSLIVVGVAAVVGALCLSLSAVLAFAVPEFRRFNLRARQAEVKTALKQAAIAERAWFSDHDEYTEVVEEAGFAPVAGNRYLYVFAPSGPLAPDSTKVIGERTRHTGIAADTRRTGAVTLDELAHAAPLSLWAEVGVRGTCPRACRITIVAGANLDDDDTIDVWSVSTVDRVIDGHTVSAGVPYRHVDDVVE